MSEAPLFDLIVKPIPRLLVRHVPKWRNLHQICLALVLI